MAIEICRICGRDQDLKNVFSEGNDELVEQIRVCANIQIDVFDCLPKLVCSECEAGLAFSYRLRKRGEETERKLRQDLLLTSIEPYSMGEESIIVGLENKFTEKFDDEEIWIKDQGAVHFSENAVLLNKAGDTNEEILPNFQENAKSDSEEWLSFESDVFSGCAEIIEDTVIEQVEVDMTHLVDINDPTDEFSDVEALVEFEGEPLEFENECKICGVLIEDKTKYLEHMTEHDRGGDVDVRRFHCAVCVKWFSTKTRYETHLKHHSTSVRDFPCPHCHRSYSNQGNMERHIRSAHIQQRNFQCPECEACFGRSDILKMHMAKHTTERTIECVVCQKKFKTSQSLHYHLRIHEDRPEPKPTVRAKPVMTSKPKVRVYQCEICGKISHHRTTHCNHLRTHTGEKPFKCSTCDKCFRTAHARSNHMLLHTDKRPHKCEICGSSFRQTSHLKSHKLIHTGIKRHICEFCEKGFTTKSNLIVHERTHTGEMPYACKKCPKKFLLSSQFKRHKLSHADDKTEVVQNESCKENVIEIGNAYHDSQISLYINDIIQEN